MDATTVGSRILFSGYFECNKGAGGAVYLYANGTIKNKYCFADEVDRLGSCYLSFYLNNPSGSQSWTATTTSKIHGDPEAARVSFAA